MTTDPFAHLKTAKGETKVVRADLIAPIRLVDGDDRSIISFTENDRGVVLAVIPQDSLPDLVAAALHTAQLARNPAKTGSTPGQAVVEVSRAIQADQLLARSPQTANAPQGHAVLEVWVGDVPIHFSAPAKQWKAVLEELTRSGSDHGTAD